MCHLTLEKPSSPVCNWSGWAVTLLIAQPLYLWISLAGNALGLFLLYRNPLAVVAALLNSPFNTDVSGLPTAINSDKIQPGKAPIQGSMG